MKQGWLTVLNMSITASYVILFVLVAWMLFKKAPKIFSDNAKIKSLVNNNKPAFRGVIVGTLLVILGGIGLISNYQNDEQDLPFLHISHTISMMTQQEQLMVRAHDSAASLVSGSKLGKLLDTTSSSWKEKKVVSPYELTPDLTVYINIGTNHKVHLYESEPELAMVQFEGQYRYYQIPQDTYKKVYMTYAVSSYFIPEEIMNAIADGKKTNLQSVQDIPNNGDYQILRVGNEAYCIYEKGGKFYVEQPYQFIHEITEEAYKAAIKFTISPKDAETKLPSEVKQLVEDNIASILSSPLNSSNPDDYIKTNQKAYENIFKYGGESALSYMLSEFEKGNIENDFRGQIMMQLCIELLGQRNNVTDEALAPKEWFSQLVIRQKIELPNFAYDGNEPIEKLVYATEVEKNKSRRGEFTIVAPHIFGSFEEGNKLKVFVTTMSQHYVLYDKTLSNEGGGIIPAAITYVKNADGNYTLEKYEQARDGSEFASSIREFCIMPISEKKINRLADQMLRHYSDYSDIINLERENLIKHLKKHNQNDVFLYQKHYQKPDERIPLT